MVSQTNNAWVNKDKSGMHALLRSVIAWLEWGENKAWAKNKITIRMIESRSRIHNIHLIWFFNFKINPARRHNHFLHESVKFSCLFFQIESSFQKSFEKLLTCWEVWFMTMLKVERRFWSLSDCCELESYCNLLPSSRRIYFKSWRIRWDECCEFLILILSF